MLTTLLSIIAIIMALLAFAAAISQSQKGLNLWSLCACLLLLALLESFDLLSLQLADTHEFYKMAALLSEALLPLCWLGYAVSLAGRESFRGFSTVQKTLTGVAAIFPGLVLALHYQGFFFSPDFLVEKVLFLEAPGYYFYLCLMAYQVVLLYYLERGLVTSIPVARRLFLYEALGAILIVAVSLLYHSQALLYRTIDMSLMPARSVAVIVGVTLIGYSRFKRERGARMQVSQHVAFQSVAVLIVGLYLLVLGGVGEGLRYLGLHDRRQVFAIIGVIIGAGVLFLLSSEKNRRKCKVFLYKHFYRHKYDYRQEWLKFTARISSAKSFEAMQAAILAFYCETFARTGAVMYLYDRDGDRYRQCLSLSLRLDIDTFPAKSALVKSMIGKDWIYSTLDQHDPELADTDVLLQLGNVELCVPLRFEESLEGFICLGAAVDKGEVLNFEDYDLMRILASQATSPLLSMKLSAQLSSAQEMAAIGKVATFIVHDLKNHVTNLSLVLSNAREYINDPDFQKEMLESLSESLIKMKNLTLSLQKVRDNRILKVVECDLLEVARSGVSAVGLPVNIVRGNSVTAHIDRDEIEKVVINLLINAKESGSSERDLLLEVGHDGEVYFTVADKGCGMAEDFIKSSLFRPFKTTKQKGFGVGLYQCRQIIEAHKGRIEVHSTVGTGTTFRICLPGASDSLATP